jgi:hypothetical protein
MIVPTLSCYDRVLGSRFRVHSGDGLVWLKYRGPGGWCGSSAQIDIGNAVFFSPKSEYNVWYDFYL